MPDDVYVRCLTCGEMRHRDRDYYRVRGYRRGTCKICFRVQERDRQRRKRHGHTKPLRPWRPMWRVTGRSQGRHCVSCREWKGWDQFHRTTAPDSPNGRVAQCKDCRRTIK